MTPPNSTSEIPIAVSTCVTINEPKNSLVWIVCSYCLTLDWKFYTSLEQIAEVWSAGCVRCRHPYPAEDVKNSAICRMRKSYVCFACGYTTPKFLMGDYCGHARYSGGTLVSCRAGRDGSELYSWTKYKGVGLMIVVDVDKLELEWRCYNRKVRMERKTELIECGDCGLFLKGKVELARHRMMHSVSGS